MSSNCPGFETLSRFSDGALEEARERDVIAHVAGCEACREALASLEEVDGQLALSLLAMKKAERPFGRLRPALLPLAAAVLFGITLSFVLMAPSGGSDSPMAVAEMTPAASLPPPEAVANVFLQDRFQAAQLSPDWRGAEESAGTSKLVQVHGRKALLLSSQPGGKKRWALLSTASEYPVAQGISFDVDYRIPKPQKGGRMQVLLQTKASKSGRGVLRWSRTFDEELLEAQLDGRSKPTVLWSSKAAPPDSDWHQLKVTVTSEEVLLQRDGIEVVRKAHGLPLERTGLTLGSTMDKRSKDPHESFECQVGAVVVRREEGR
jgi:hypothetical protein